MKTKHRWYIIAAAVLLAAAAAVGILGYFRYGSLVPGAGSGNNAGRELVLEQNYAYARRAQQAVLSCAAQGCIVNVRRADDGTIQQRARLIQEKILRARDLAADNDEIRAVFSHGCR